MPKREAPAAVSKILVVAPEKRSFDQQRTVFASAMGSDPELLDLTRRLEAVDRELGKGVSTMVLAELPSP